MFLLASLLACLDYHIHGPGLQTPTDDTAEPAWYYDGDGDGYGLDTTRVDTQDAPGDGFVDRGGDCNDNDATVFPGRGC